MPNENIATSKVVPIRIGERLRDQVEDLIARYSARLRSDPQIPVAKTLSAPLIEDHAMSFLSDVFQSLVILENAASLKGREESNLLSDGTTIQRLISELHGRQRHRVGWTETALKREYEILNEEAEKFVRRHAADESRTGGLDWTLGVVNRLLRHAEDASFAAFTVAAGAAESRKGEAGNGQRAGEARSGKREA